MWVQFVSFIPFQVCSLSGGWVAHLLDEFNGWLLISELRCVCVSSSLLFPILCIYFLYWVYVIVGAWLQGKLEDAILRTSVGVLYVCVCWVFGIV